MQDRQTTPTFPLKFYCAWYCPFAQRAWMALLHKGLDFEYIEVDPYRESPWWLHISRNRSKVPVIVSSPGNATESTTVIDSTRVLEYLEDLVPDRNPLYPGDANAKGRAWKHCSVRGSERGQSRKT